MTTNYHCPDCHGQLVDVGVANAWRCTRDNCQRVIVEAVDETARNVREFYRRASPARWGGLRWQ